MLNFSKSQITIFIIIGLIALITIGLTFFFLRKIILKPVIEKIPVVTKAPVEIEPITAFVERCLGEVGEDALIRVGDHGGWVKADFQWNPLAPTESEAVEFASGSNLLIPYWLYLKSRNTCTGVCEFASKQPALKRPAVNAIETQIDAHVLENLPSCIRDFIDFAPEFEISELAPAKATTTISSTNVWIKLDWPLKVKKGDVVYEVKEWVSLFDVPLRRMYELAQNITQLQSEYQFLEQHMKNLIAIFSAPKEDRLPPPSDTTFELSGGVRWIKFDIEQRIKEMIAAYTPMLQTWGVRNYRYILAPIGRTDPERFEIIYNRGMFIPIPDVNPDLEIKITYLPWWPIYFDLDCRGAICEPDSILHTFGFIFPLQMYSFAYDISWPNIIEIFAPEALNGRGYSFKFALEGNLRAGEPMPANYTPLTTIDLPTGSLLCAPEQATGANLTVLVLDGYEKRPLSEANVLFRCANEVCNVGTTNAQGLLKAKLPKCIGGAIGVEKADYFAKWQEFDSDLEMEENLTIFLYQFKELNASIKYFRMIKAPFISWTLNEENAVSLESDEEFVVTLRRIPNEWENEHSTVAQIHGDPKIPQIKELKLLPGNYSLSVFGVKRAKEPIVIPVEKRCIKIKKKYGKKECKCFDIPDKPIVFNETNPLPLGNFELAIEITPDDLKEAKKIEFYGIKFALDDLQPPTIEYEGECKGKRKISYNVKIEDLTTLDSIPKIAPRQSELLKPRLIK